MYRRGAVVAQAAHIATAPCLAWHKLQKLLLATRIQLVQDYLTRDDMTVTQMAQVLGFADVSVVSRFLKTHVGRSAKAIKVRSRRPKTRRSGEKRPYA